MAVSLKRLRHTDAVIKACGDPTATSYLDMSIYKHGNKQQLLLTIGGCKPGDTRVLQPVGDFPLEAYLAQYLTGDEFRLTKPSESIEDLVVERPMVGVGPPDWEAVVQVLTNAGFTNPRYRGRRESSLTFTCDLQGHTCLCCNYTHDNNNWMIMLRDDGCFNVKNYSQRCQVLTIGQPSTLVISEPPSSLQKALEHLGLTQHIHSGLDRDWQTRVQSHLQVQLESRASKEPAASPPVSPPAGVADGVNKAAVHSDIMRAVKAWWPRKVNDSLIVGKPTDFLDNNKQVGRCCLLIRLCVQHCTHLTAVI